MAKIAGDLNVSGDFAPPGYIEPDGFLLENTQINTKTSVQLAAGGVINMEKLSTGTNVVFNVPDGTQAEADNSTYLLKGTWQADTWYYIGLEGDSSGTNSPKLVYVQEGNDITNGDLDSGYDCFASLSQPRSGWVRTDGSGNLKAILWTTDGTAYTSDNWREEMRDVFSTSSPATSWSSIDLSAVVPPAPVRVSSAFSVIGPQNIGIGNRSQTGLWPSADAIISIGTTDAYHANTDIYYCENQSVNYIASNGTNQFSLRNVLSFEVVGE